MSTLLDGERCRRDQIYAPALAYELDVTTLTTVRPMESFSRTPPTNRRSGFGRRRVGDTDYAPAHGGVPRRHATSDVRDVGSDL
jgi:hypothetical protein